MENSPSKTWYEEVFELTDLKSSSPDLESFVNPDNLPDWVNNVLAELVSQSSPAISIKELRDLTPEKLGRFLGQKCANAYALGEQLETGLGKKDQLTQAISAIKKLEKLKNKPGVESLLHTMNIAGNLVLDFAKDFERFNKNVHDAFQKALDQPSHQEAADFFMGFAKGISKKGLSPKGLAASTTATLIYSKLYFHWQEIDKLPTVTALRNFLIKNGVPENAIGQIDRLRKLCTRIGYSPAKRGRPKNK